MEDSEWHPWRTQSSTLPNPGCRACTDAPPAHLPPGSPRTPAGHDTAHQHQLTDTEINSVQKTHLFGKAQQS